MIQTVKPLVSIALATYNGEKYIAQLLNSVINQTCLNIEIIITDDGSKDNTVSIIREFQKTFSSIKLFVKEKNTGYTKTFEQSIKECKGEFIAICDQDDIWKPDKIELLVKEIGEADAIYSNSMLIDEKGVSLNKEYKAVANLRSFYGGAPFLMANCVSGHSIVMKNNFAQKILPFPDNIMFDRWISFCAASNNGLKYLDKPLVEYRQHDNNVFGVGKTNTKTYKKTNDEKFREKLEEIKTFALAPIKDKKTKIIIAEMYKYFNRRWSLKRSLFFFRNLDEILVIKKRPRYRRVLYCIKMFFKPNY